MPNPLDEEEAHNLATLDELEATQELISGYQSLLKDLPQIYERKFNERLKPILDRRQQLMDEKNHLLLQLKQPLPPHQQPPPLLESSSRPLAPEEADAELASRIRWRRWGCVVGFAMLGIAFGRHLSHQVPRVTQPPVSRTASLNARLPQPPNLRSRIVEQAMAEWEFFDKPAMRNEKLIKAGKNEGDPGCWQRVITYWQKGLMTSSPSRQADVSSEQYPWSAAFISYVMRQAGAGSQFPYAAAHSIYIKAAIANSEINASEVGPLAHQPSRYAPRPGDLICSTNKATAGDVTYENAPTYGFFPSRCDVVISNSRDQIGAIGGDLMDAVSMRSLKAIDGKLAPVAGQNWLVVIQAALAD